VWGEGSPNNVYTCKMYTHVSKCKNDKIKGEKKKKNGEMIQKMIYLIHCKLFCKCHNIPPCSTINKK
jgi:hypothetical protein